jgi:hypothetical protein
MNSRGGGGGPGPWNPVVGHVPFRVGYDVTWYPDEPVPGQAANLGFVRQQIKLLAPIWQDSTDEWFINARLRNETFDSNAYLPMTGLHFPSELWDLHTGTGYRHQFDNGWIGGLGVGIGSASDQPFANINQVTVGANASLQIPVREHDALILTLTYSNNTDFLNGFPIPGIAYLWQPNDWFRALVGFPYAQIWVRPRDDLWFELSYHWLYTFEGRVTYRLAPRWRIYAGYSTGNESYFLAQTVTADDDRLFYAEQRVFTGLGVGVMDHVSVDLTGGYAFDRSYSEGKTFQDRTFNRIVVGDGGFVGLSVNVRF